MRHAVYGTSGRIAARLDALVKAGVAYHPRPFERVVHSARLG